MACQQIVFAADDQLISAGFDGDINFWNLQDSGAVAIDNTRAFEITQDYVWRMRISPDRTRLLTSAFSQEKGKQETTLTVQAWDVATGLPIGEPLLDKTYGKTEAASAYEHDVAWSPDGKQAVLATKGRLCFYDTSDWHIQMKLKEKEGRVQPASVAYSPEQEGVIATYDGRTVHLWEFAEENNRTEGFHVGTLPLKRQDCRGQFVFR